MIRSFIIPLTPLQNPSPLSYTFYGPYLSYLRYVHPFDVSICHRSNMWWNFSDMKDYESFFYYSKLKILIKIRRYILLLLFWSHVFDKSSNKIIQSGLRLIPSPSTLFYSISLRNSISYESWTIMYPHSVLLLMSFVYIGIQANYLLIHLWPW